MGRLQEIMRVELYDSVKERHREGTRERRRQSVRERLKSESHPCPKQAGVKAGQVLLSFVVIYL